METQTNRTTYNNDILTLAGLFAVISIAALALGFRSRKNKRKLGLKFGKGRPHYVEQAAPIK